MSNDVKALIIVPGSLTATAREALAPLSSQLDACAGIDQSMDLVQERAYDLVVVSSEIDPDLVGVCGELRLHLPRTTTIIAIADPTPALLSLLGDTLDDAIRPPLIPSELRHRAQERMRLRAVHHRGVDQGMDALRSQCLRLLGHDLNNPLTAIRILAEMMAADFDDPELRRDAEDMLEASDLAAAIIESLSGMMRVEGGDDEPTAFPMDLADLVREVVARPFLRNNVRLILPDAPVMMRGDRRSLSRALADFFLLAQRLCDSKGRFDIQVSSTATHATVKIQHPAMVLPAQRDKLVELYGTVPLRAERVPVTAAGLAYTGVVARAHGGQVVFEPGPEGSTSIALVMEVG